MKFTDYYKKNTPKTTKEFRDLIVFAKQEIKEWEKFIKQCDKKLKEIK
jgi:hypothetical protein